MKPLHTSLLSSSQGGKALRAAPAFHVKWCLHDSIPCHRDKGHCRQREKEQNPDSRAALSCLCWKSLVSKCTALHCGSFRAGLLHRNYLRAPFPHKCQLTAICHLQRMSWHSPGREAPLPRSEGVQMAEAVLEPRSVLSTSCSQQVYTTSHSLMH